MDILDIFGHFYLNHLSRLWGYFFVCFWLASFQLMAEWVISDIGQVVDKVCVYIMKGQW